LAAVTAPTSPRLTYTPVVHDDRTFLESCWDDLELRRHLGGAMPQEKRDRIFASFLASDSAWILRLANGVPVGSGFVVDADGKRELGLELIVGAQRLGLGREAAVAILDWLAARAVPEVIAVVQEENRASNGLVRSLGGVEQTRYEKWGARQIEYLVALGPPPGAARTSS
jgi:RimJ/RimL family protein N-acetyltransferase